MGPLTGKDIVLGITGGIAAYKSADLARQLIKQGGRVHVIMTDSAREFVSPLTFQTLTGNPVTTGLFHLYDEKKIGHIALAQRADILAVAPATANCLGKVAGGIADDMLTTVIMATEAPVLFAPAMNVHMWDNAIVQENVGKLRAGGYHFIEPGRGELACGEEGTGRLAEVEDIVDEIITILAPKDFAGKRVLVTAGPTREPLDPVRFLSNPSSGKMGYAIAQAFCRRGADVTLISGPTAEKPPRRADHVSVKTARDMYEQVESCFPAADIVVKTAAVSDYSPRNVAEQKLKKTGGSSALELERTPDILAGLGRKKGSRILVGFAAETQDLLDNAREKLRSKNLDLIVANDVSRSDAGFGLDVNKVTFLYPDGSADDLPVLSKGAVAEELLDRIARLLKKQ